MDSIRDRSTTGRVISLLTDFGTTDGYVGAMKGVILGLNPRVSLVDITHEIPPQDVRGGGFVLHGVHSYFPKGTIHVAVVDPGVGTERAAVILDTGRELFVSPDNGLLSFVLAESRNGRRGDGATGRFPLPVGEGQGEGGESTTQSSVLGPQTPAPGTQSAALELPIPEGWRAVQITEPRFWLPNPSSTFHGRDIFAPVAAHLSRGEPLESFGPPMKLLKTFSIPTPRRLPSGEVEGEVLHVDRFGNLVTNLRVEDLPGGQTVTEIAGRRLWGLRRTYAESTGLMALTGSSGYLEIALPGGSARQEIGVGVGTPVRVSGSL